MTDKSKPDQDEQKDELPIIIRTLDELDSALETGLKSGESELSCREIVDRALVQTAL